MPDVWTNGPALISALAAVGGVVVAAIGLRSKRKAAAASGPTTCIPARIKLVDRVSELTQVRRLLDSNEPVITVEGGRGVGTSTFAREAAHDHAERVGRRRRGKRIVRLMWLDAENGCLDLADVARKVGLQDDEPSLPGAPAKAKKEALISYFAANPETVLVIDNLRLPADEPSPLHDFLQSLPSGTRAIVSSNTVGMLDGPRIILSELPETDARTLIMQEAERRGVTDLAVADSPLVDRVYRLVGGNAQAIKLFITACIHQPGAVAELLDDIEAGAGETDTVYDVVWTELSEQARATLSLCALLHAVNHDQVAIALDLTDAETKRALRQLRNDWLLESSQSLGRTVYRCPTALRTGALEHADGPRLDRARDRLAESLTDRFARDWENAAEAAHQIEAIRTLIQALASAGQYRLCVNLFAAVYDMLLTLGLFDDRITLGWVACEAASELGSVEEQSLALSVVSSTHALRGEDAEAAHAVKTGLDLARKAGSQKEIARQLRCEAFRLYRAGRVQEALDLLLSEDAEGMARDAGDPHNMIDILSLIAAAQFHLGDYEGCEATARRELAECERLPWQRAKAYPLRDLAEARLMLGDPRTAEDLAAQARTVAVARDDTRQTARIGLTEARLHLFAGRLRQARDTANQAVSATAKLLLRGEKEEAEAVAEEATRCLRLPWRRWRVVGKPRGRFTEWTIGGD